jgi:tetratricopeptide (TPR) repeat protein
VALFLLGFLLPGASGSRAAPPTPPATQPALRPVTRPAGPSDADRRRAAQLSRKSIELLEQRKLDPAEKTLRQALELDPDDSTNLYNLACTLALKNSPDDAMDYLEKSADAGFTDFIHIGQDSDLESLRELPRFKQFMARKDAYQHKAADHAVAALKSRFGDSYLYEVDDADKLVFATNIDRATLDDLKHTLEAQAHSQWEQIFDHKPDEFVTIVVPSLADYKKLVRMPGVGGFYNNDAKILIAQHLGQVMTHEFTHALHAADRAPLGQDHPIWLAEGLASLYESATFEGKNHDELIPHDNFRLTFLQNAARGHSLLPLAHLLKMKQPEFISRANLAYGESSSLLLYLYEHQLLKKFYDAYKTGFDTEPTGKAALEQVTGKSLDDLEKSWTTWMVHRTPPSLTTGPDGPFLGAHLVADANDGLKLESILPGSPAEKAGLKTGDVLVGIGDVEVRDMQSFGPLMNTHKPGDEVSVKVRRDGKYLDVPLTLAKRSTVLSAIEGPRGQRRNVPNPPATRPTTNPSGSPTTKPEGARQQT